MKYLKYSFGLLSLCAVLMITSCNDDDSFCDEATWYQRWTGTGSTPNSMPTATNLPTLTTAGDTTTKPEDTTTT